MNLLSTPHAIKLCNIQVNLENSIDPILERLKKYSEYDLFELATDLEKTRENEWKSLQIKVGDILKPLKSKMLLIKSEEFGNISDVKQFKKEMILIQDNIQNIKFDNKKQIEHLEKEVLDLTDDVNFYSQKLLEWEAPIQINTNQFTNFQKPRANKTRHWCKEIKEFMDFVHQSGGHENGWRQEDHNLFLKFRKKFKHIDTVAEKLHEELPDLSIEDIKLHDKWYQKYINLEMKKRNALKLWQKEKAKKTRVTKYSNIPPKISRTAHTSGNIQEKLNTWKAQKEEQEKIAKEIEINNKQKRSEIEKLRQSKNEELKEFVHEWKQRRQKIKEDEIKEKQIEAVQEKKRKALAANRLIKQFQSQDDIYILKMKQKRKPEPFPVKRSKSSHSAKRDPDRLLKPTQQWINRVHDENSYDKFANMPLRCLPKLRIPEWRKKLD